MFNGTFERHAEFEQYPIDVRLSKLVSGLEINVALAFQTIRNLEK